MKCYLCGNDRFKPIYSYNEPDKYLKAIGLIQCSRTWWHCKQCGLYFNNNGLIQKQLEDVYLRYRDSEMRGTSVAEEFERIQALPVSENRLRCIWVTINIADKRPQSMLDIGSGLGVFPYEMKKAIPHVCCIEPEAESATFINNKLNINCFNGFYKKGMFGESELVTLVHVLEHFKDPIGTLKDIKEHDLKPNGTLFIEVPDAEEFEYLDKQHDEFNSLHLWFFTVGTLDRILRKAGFISYRFERVKYKERNLSRIRCLADAI